MTGEDLKWVALAVRIVAFAAALAAAGALIWALVSL